MQLDTRVLQACGVHASSVVTALTAQNTRGVRRVFHVPPRFVAEQIDTVAADLKVAAAKTGMLGRAQVVEVVAERVRRREIPTLVIDPVLHAKDGTPLLAGRGLASLKRSLLPRALVVTPNVPEAELLSGREIRNAPSLRDAARAIADLGVPGVVIKGGHLPGDPVDTLLWQGEFVEFPGERLPGCPVRGTGCCYSAALAARLALGDTAPQACAFAHELVRHAIRQAVVLGRGARVIGEF